MADTCIFSAVKINFAGRIANSISVKLDSGVILNFFDERHITIIATFIPSNLLRELPVTQQEKDRLTAVFLEVL